MDFSTGPEELFQLIGEREFEKHKLAKEIERLNLFIYNQQQEISKLRDDNGRLEQSYNSLKLLYVSTPSPES